MDLRSDYVESLINFRWTSSPKTQSPSWYGWCQFLIPLLCNCSITHMTAPSQCLFPLLGYKSDSRSHVNSYGHHPAAEHQPTTAPINSITVPTGCHVNQAIKQKSSKVNLSIKTRYWWGTPLIYKQYSFWPSIHRVTS